MRGESSMLLGLSEKDPEAEGSHQGIPTRVCATVGWIEGRNVYVDYRFAGTNPDLIDKHVAELVRLAPDVIVANSTPVMAALRPATSTIPIVFVDRK